MRVRLCFLVKVRKATGRSVVGGRRIGRMDTLGGATGTGLATFVGYTGGVPKPGDEENVGFVGGCRGVPVATGIVVGERLAFKC